MPDTHHGISYGPIAKDLFGKNIEHNIKEYSSAIAFLDECGIEHTRDAVEQLVDVFLPCLKIMCERGFDPNGGTWRKSGRLGALSDARKKFERLWERAWGQGKRHDDSALDLVNYIGFYLRSDKEGWGDWGEPYWSDHQCKQEDNELCLNLYRGKKWKTA